MNAYLDSTKRRHRWEDAFPGIADIFSGNCPTFENVSVFFLHESDLLPASPDDHLEDKLAAPLHRGRNFDASEIKLAVGQAIALRDYLRKSGLSPKAPALVIYSGDGFDGQKGNDVKLSVSKCLKNYPRIYVLERPLDRGTKDVNAFRAVVEAFVQEIVQEPKKNPNAILEDKSFRREGALALLLLCRAWSLNEISAGGDNCKFKIHSPQNPGDWFIPFATEPSLEGADEISKDRVPQLVAAQVKGFLTEIFNRNSVDEEGVRQLERTLTALISNPNAS